MWFKRNNDKARKQPAEPTDELSSNLVETGVHPSRRRRTVPLSSGNIYDTPNMLKFPSRGRIRRRRDEIRR